jgi:hypothetical protein
MSRLEDAVEARRRDRAAQIAGALERLAGRPLRLRSDLRPEVAYALLHHTVVDLKAAAEAGDRERPGRIIAFWESGEPLDCVVPSPLGGVAVAGHGDARAIDRGTPDARLWALDLAEPRPLPADRRALVAEALAAIAGCGCEDVVRRGMGALLLLEPRTFDEANRSWSTPLLPCTVHADYYLVPAFLGAELVHESAHNWLNDCLGALDLTLPPDELYYSPWKGRRRSAFGVLHAALAFASVHAYLSALLERGLLDDEGSVRFCRARIALEGGRLAEAGPEFDAALRQVPDRELLGVLVTALERTGVYARVPGADLAAS